MQKEEIIKILKTWNFWDKPLDTGIERKRYLDYFESLLESKEIVAVTGVRRSGKSYLMKQMAKRLIEERGISKDQILIANFEDSRFTDLNADLLEQIFEVYKQYRQPKGDIYVFLDEVQQVERWEKWVRMMHELDNAYLAVSGSNAELLGGELATTLTGRHLDIEVFPLSFEEFLKFKSEGGADISQIDVFLREYLKFGGFPKVVLEKDENKKQSTIVSYFRDIINKDLIKRHNIRKGEQLKSLAKFYLSNTSNLSSFNALEKHLKISANTIEKFSGYLDMAYLTFFMKRFFFKVREQEKSPRKIYSVDPGFANTIGFRFSENIGNLAENLVFLELRRRQLTNSVLEFYYWRNDRQEEVDFVVKDIRDKSGQLIQVCWDVNDLQTKKREFRSLLKAMAEFKLNMGLVITGNYEGEEKVDEKVVKFIPLGKWLLGKK